MIDVRCSCGTQMQLGDEWAGKTGRCPQCGVKLQIGPAGPPTSAFAPPAKPHMVPRPPQPVSAAAVRPAPPPPAPPPVSIPSSRTSSAHPVAMAHVESAAGRWRAALIGGAMLGLLLALLAVGLFVWSHRGQTTDTDLAARTPNDSLASRSPARENDPLHPRSDPPLPPSPVTTEGPGNTAGHAPSPAAVQDATPAAPRREITHKATPSVATGSRPRPAEGSGLKGVSTQYDDFHCVRIQRQFGVRIPLGVNQIEVDGLSLPIADPASFLSGSAPYLILSKGRHSIRWRGGERPVPIEIKDDFWNQYEDLRKFFDVAGRPRREEVLTRGARTFDVHHAPFLLNVQGATYAAEEKWDAAERQFRRALRVNPAFGPAHLNLAYCMLRAGRSEEAAREIRLADALNVGNVFGLAAPLADMRRQAGLPQEDREVVSLNFQAYVSQESLSEVDERLSALMRAMSKYAVAEEDRGKILNNLAIHFFDAGRIELALDHFRESLDAIRQAGPQRFQLARSILANMERACQVAGYAEVDDYRWMQGAVSP